MHKAIPSRLPALFLLVSLPFTAQPSRPGRLNPPHLTEMPTVSRVLEEISAPDPLLAAARQMGAFEQLNEVIEELSGGRAALGTPTPDESRIMQEYRDARLAAMNRVYRGPQDDALLPKLRQFDADPDLRQELLKRFFSPALQSQSTALSRQLQARRSAMRQQNVAFGGQAAPTARPTAPQPATTKPKPPLSPDPSIAKANAAGVDTKAFGIQLGDRISLPACSTSDMLITPKTTCLVAGDLALATSLLSALEPGLGEIHNIKLARDSCPQWLSQCMVLASVENERLISLTMQPDGHKVEQETARELRAKYGARFAARERIITPDSGAAQFRSYDLEWNFPGLHVFYRPVHETIYKGLIRIETDRAYELRLAREKEANRPRL